MDLSFLKAEIARKKKQIADSEVLVSRRTHYYQMGI